MSNIVKVVFNPQDPTDESVMRHSFIAHEEYRVGDLVVVNTKNGLFVATVVETDRFIHLPDSTMIQKEVVGKVNTSKFYEKALKKRRCEELEEILSTYVEGMEKLSVYKLLSEINPKMKGLVAELEELMAETNEAIALR